MRGAGRIRNPETLAALSREWEERGRFQRALDFAEAAVVREPDRPKYLALAARINRLMNRTDRESELLRRLYERSPSVVRLHRLILAEHRANEENPLRSEAPYQELLSGELDAAERHARTCESLPIAERLALARILVLAGRSRDAEEVLNDALQIASPSERTSVLVELGAAAQSDENDDVAIDRCFRALQEGVSEHVVTRLCHLLRASGRIEEGLEIGLRYLQEGGPGVALTCARLLFYLEEYEESERILTDIPPGDRHKPEARYLAAAAALERGLPGRCLGHLSRLSQDPGLQAVFLAFAAWHRARRADRGLTCLDPVFASVGIRCLRRDERLGPSGFDQFIAAGRFPSPESDHSPLFNGPLVSIVMTTWNSERYVATAIRSILDQSYRNLELIIVDDGSTDGTLRILRRAAEADGRVRLILRDINEGTFVSKNRGILEAGGDYLAFHDSDDWSHPDRLSCSLGLLEARPELRGMVASWVRMTDDGNPLIQSSGDIVHPSCISLVFRREVMETVGFFDSVRFGADSEFIARMRLAFGERNVPTLPWPLMFGRSRPDSLTRTELTAITRTGLSEVRRRYVSASEAFHKEIRSGRAAVYMPFPLVERPFDAPAVVLPDAGVSAG